MNVQIRGTPSPGEVAITLFCMQPFKDGEVRKSGRRTAGIDGLDGIEIAEAVVGFGILVDRRGGDDGGWGAAASRCVAAFDIIRAGAGDPGPGQIHGGGFVASQGVAGAGSGTGSVNGAGVQVIRSGCSVASPYYRIVTSPDHAVQSTSCGQIDAQGSRQPGVSV